MSFAVLFCGQGTQHADMLPWLEAEPNSQAALVALNACLGADWRIALRDTQTRTRNQFAQPLIVGTALAAWAALRRELQLAAALAEPSLPTVVAGYSVGELAAFACAGLFDAPAALHLAVQRAAFMDAAVAGQDTGLLSVSGMAIPLVLAHDARLDCAIHIAADRAVYAAQTAVLMACSTDLARQGATCKLLDVRVASHSRWMAAAAAQFADVVRVQAWPHAACKVALNASGVPSRMDADLRQSLSRQLCMTVQWAACMDAVAEQGVRCVMEVGAGSALANMWNARHAAIPARSLEDFRDAAGAARWMASRLRA
jgi:[acyl-carrier-protein] S-malonyltransferase